MKKQLAFSFPRIGLAGLFQTMSVPGLLKGGK